MSDGPLRGLRPGDHACWAYGSDDEFWSGAATYLAEGAEGGDKLLVFSRSLAPDAALDRLRADGLPAADLAAGGQLMVVPAEPAYLPDGRWDAHRMVQSFADNGEHAVAEGWRALRAVAETAWVLPHVGGLDDLLSYELQAGRVVQRGHLTGLCAYHADQADPEWVAGLHTVHPVRVQLPAQPEIPFSCSIDAGGRIVVEGEVDLLAVEPFERALELAAAVADDLTVDLSGLRFVNVAGLRAIARLARSAGARTLVLQSPPPLFRRCWELLEFDRLPNVAVA